MKRGFQWCRRILAIVVLTRENGAVARKARHQGGSGACPPRKILGFRPPEIISGAIWR